MQQDLWRRLKPTFCLVAAAVVVLLAETALGCPTCKDGIADADPAAQRMAAGSFYSLLFMLSAPVVILGTLRWSDLTGRTYLAKIAWILPVRRCLPRRFWLS